MTDRIPLDHLNSDQLDQLYDRLAAAEQEADTSVAAAAHLTTLVGKRSERAERDADKQRVRADIAETELRTLRSGLRAIGGDPTQIQNLWAQIRLRNRQWREEKQRAARAETELQQYAAADSADAAAGSYAGRAEHAEQENAELRRRVATLEHVAASNKRHVQLIVPELERAEATLARIAALAEEHPAGIDTALIHEALDQPAPGPTENSS